MYNRYIPKDAPYTRVAEERPEPERKPGPPPPPAREGGFQLPRFLTGKEGLSGLFSGKGGTGGLLKALKLDNIDKGDVLLLLIILLLLSEGDDLELVIALGLVLLMSLGDQKEEEPDGT